MTTVSSFGKLSALPHQIVTIHHKDQIRHHIQRSMEQGIAYGMGRSYGDVCLNPNGQIWMTSNLDRFIAFDEKTGLLQCEAGLTLQTIQQLMVPRGWMLPVTPGTQLITVGGAVANDIHGKNHHQFGTFGHHIHRLILQRTDGQTLACSQTDNADWFAATVGGLGLTGFIVEVTIQLRPIVGPWLKTETMRYANLAAFFQYADQSETDWEHTVAWIDCAHKHKQRGLFMRAKPCQSTGKHHSTKRTLTLPITPPFSLVNPCSLRLFNAAYYHLKSSQTKPKIKHYTAFLYPLDYLSQWNRLYGPKGFYQYQSVVPRDVSHEATHAMLKAIEKANDGSFLTVLKTFGDKPSLGMLSFAKAGTTLALDFPNKGAKTEQLFARLDAIVKEAKGRIYPAKDARMSQAMFEQGYPRLHEFIKYRDPGISSAFAKRVMGD